jgi:hypothetical protein
MLYWTAAPMTAPGPRKGEPSSSSMRNGFQTQPAQIVRGSSRRIMTLRFRPANIRVINRRASSSAVISPAVRKRKADSPLCRGKPAWISDCQTWGLDRSLHIRAVGQSTSGAPRRAPRHSRSLGNLRPNRSATFRSLASTEAAGYSQFRPAQPRTAHLLVSKTSASPGGLPPAPAARG